MQSLCCRWYEIFYVFIGRRFLDFPEKKYCCFCCDSTHGCGIVSPDWIAKSNGTYQGT
jgi:hypothetical protein